jgi:hypothetical protein
LSAAILACVTASPCLAQCGPETFESAALQGSAAWVTLYPSTDAVPGVYVSGRFSVNGVHTGLVKRVNGARVAVTGAPESLGAMKQHVDKRGSALYVASGEWLGEWPTRIPSLYRFDGTRWEEVPSPGSPGPYVYREHINSLASFDPDGGGPQLSALNMSLGLELLGDVWDFRTGTVYRLDQAGWTVVPGDLFGQLVVYERDVACPQNAPPY